MTDYKPVHWLVAFVLLVAGIGFAVRTIVLAVREGFLEWFLPGTGATVIMGFCLFAIFRVFLDGYKTK